MGTYKEVEGNLIALAQAGEFDVIAHGVNCWCRQKSGLAPQMVKAFGTDRFPMENPSLEGDINKLGRIDYQELQVSSMSTIPKGYKGLATQELRYDLIVVNCYTQFKIKKFNDFDYVYTTPGLPFDYDAFTICMRKMNYIFAGKRIGLPVIGGHLAGGNPEIIKSIIQKEFTQCDVTLVVFKP